MVGIISHVSELKQRIPLILEVTSNQYESHTQFRKIKNRDLRFLTSNLKLLIFNTLIRTCINSLSLYN